MIDFDEDTCTQLHWIAIFRVIVGVYGSAAPANIAVALIDGYVYILAATSIVIEVVSS